MSYRGIVKQGRIELEQDVHLPEGTMVRIELDEPASDPADRLSDEAVDTDWNDLASRHDHYLYYPMDHRG